jgi:Transglycosylase-like domain
MRAASRHAKPRSAASKFGLPVVAAAALAGVAAAFVFLPSGSAATKSARRTTPVTSLAAGFTSEQITAKARHQAASRVVREAARSARQKYLAAQAAARRAKQRAARRAAAAQAAKRAAAQATPSPSASPPPQPASSGSDAAHSPLGDCIRNAEEGGSYAWGPGNGGGAYQFILGTWEKYGGAASEYGVAGPAYQDQIFDNAIAAGGASNWTAYDGC